MQTYETTATELQTKFKTYAPTDAAGATDIKYSVFYDLGGYNYFNGSRNRRGYYLSVAPVSRSDANDGFIVESFAMFSGTKYFISPAELTRNSTKAASDARKAITADLIRELTEHVTSGAN